MNIISHSHYNSTTLPTNHTLRAVTVIHYTEITSAHTNMPHIALFVFLEKLLYASVHPIAGRPASWRTFHINAGGGADFGDAFLFNRSPIHLQLLSLYCLLSVTTCILRAGHTPSVSSHTQPQQYLMFSSPIALPSNVSPYASQFIYVTIPLYTATANHLAIYTLPVSYLTSRLVFISHVVTHVRPVVCHIILSHKITQLTHVFGRLYINICFSSPWARLD